MAPLLGNTELSLALSDRYVVRCILSAMYAGMGVCVDPYVLRLYLFCLNSSLFGRYIRVLMHAFMRLVQPSELPKQNIFDQIDQFLVENSSRKCIFLTNVP